MEGKPLRLACVNPNKKKKSLAVSVGIAELEEEEEEETGQTERMTRDSKTRIHSNEVEEQTKNGRKDNGNL